MIAVIIPIRIANTMKNSAVNKRIGLLLAPALKKKPEKDVISATAQCKGFILTIDGLIRIKKSNEIVAL